jgi:hypothetical protein
MALILDDTVATSSRLRRWYLSMLRGYSVEYIVRRPVSMTMRGRVVYESEFVMTPKEAHAMFPQG